jgi:hypothetical protein
MASLQLLQLRELRKQHAVGYAAKAYVVLQIACAVRFVSWCDRDTAREKVAGTQQQQQQQQHKSHERRFKRRRFLKRWQAAAAHTV